MLAAAMAKNGGFISGEDPRLVEAQDRLDEDLSLDALARSFGYSPFHFHRVFTREVGETPKAHVDRLRLERGWLLVAVTDESILDIALTVGFKSHETFARAFKRCYGLTPTEFRRRAKAAQKERVERNRSFRGAGCTLSEVRFVRLPATRLLAIRHVQSYATLRLAPLTADDPYWTTLVAWAEAKKIAYTPVAIGIYHDIPGVTPEDAQRSDFCIPLGAGAEPTEPFRCIPFEAGEFGVIEHLGPYTTIDQAYRNLADEIRRAADRYMFDSIAPFQIFREVHIGGDPNLNRTEVYFRVTRRR
jgi:AraC family transcriptional regulator